MFIRFASNSFCQYSFSVKKLSPVVDETTLGSEEYSKVSKYVLSLFGKTCKNVVCMIGDNCSTNECLVYTWYLPLRECAGHRFNLAVNGLLENYDDVLTVIQSLMGELRGLLLTALLLSTTMTFPTRRADAFSFSWSSLKTRWSLLFRTLLNFKWMMQSEYVRLFEPQTLLLIHLALVENSVFTTDPNLFPRKPCCLVVLAKSS